MIIDNNGFLKKKTIIEKEIWILITHEIIIIPVIK